jgi:hypothetical protein
LGDDKGFIPTELCVPGAQVRAVRLQGLQKILRSINSGAGWIHTPIIVEAKKMKYGGSKKASLWYRVIDGMHRVTVAKQLLAAGNRARAKVTTLRRLTPRPGLSPLPSSMARNAIECN